MVSNRGLIGLAYTIVVAMFICHTMWFALVRVLPAAVAALGTLAIPIVGVYSSALVLGEQIGAREVNRPLPRRGSACRGIGYAAGWALDGNASVSASVTHLHTCGSNAKLEAWRHRAESGNCQYVSRQHESHRRSSFTVSHGALRSFRVSTNCARREPGSCGLQRRRSGAVYPGPSQ